MNTSDLAKFAEWYNKMQWFGGRQGAEKDAPIDEVRIMFCQNRYDEIAAFYVDVYKDKTPELDPEQEYKRWKRK